MPKTFRQSNISYAFMVIGSIVSAKSEVSFSMPSAAGCWTAWAEMVYVALLEEFDVIVLLLETFPAILPFTFQKPKLTFVSKEAEDVFVFELATLTSILKLTSAESRVKAGTGTKDSSGASMENFVGVTVPFVSSTTGRV